LISPEGKRKSKSKKRKKHKNTSYQRKEKYAKLNPPLPLGNDEAGDAFMRKIPRRYEGQVKFSVKKSEEGYASRLRKEE